MAIQTASSSAGTAVPISNSIRTQYQAIYIDAAMHERLYDQIATTVADNPEMIRGSSVQWQFLSDMAPGTSAISEVADITPQALRDATGSLTPTSRAEAIQVSELALIQAFTPYGEKMMQKVGKGAQESIDLVAQGAALQGTFVQRAIARASLDAGTSTHLLTDSAFRAAALKFAEAKVPDFSGVKPGASQGTYVAIMHPALYNDLYSNANGNVVTSALYQNAGVLFNYEFGSINNFRLVVSPWAKVFWGAGADNGTDVIATSLSAAANALATTVTCSASTHLDSLLGRKLAIGTEETGNTFYAANESVAPVSATASVITFIGEGPNGGLRFDHTTSDLVRNADNVYTVCFGGPSSLFKDFDPGVGEFGQIVVKDQGLVNQFHSVGFKWYGGYARVAENRVLRGEYSASADA